MGPHDGVVVSDHAAKSSSPTKFTLIPGVFSSTGGAYQGFEHDPSSNVCLEFDWAQLELCVVFVKEGWVEAGVESAHLFKAPLQDVCEAVEHVLPNVHSREFD